MARRLTATVTAVEAAEAICEHLNVNLTKDGGWKLKEYPLDPDETNWRGLGVTYQEVIHPATGMDLVVKLSGENRIEVYGFYPNNWQGNTCKGRGAPDTITVSVARSAQVIAADFGRRFWPDYQRAYSEGVTEVREWQERRDAQLANLAAVRDILKPACYPGDLDGPPRDRPSVSLGRLTLDNNDRMYGEVNIDPDRLEIHLRSCPVAVGLEVLALLKRHHDAHAAAQPAPPSPSKRVYS